MPIPDLVETDLPVTVEAVPVESDGRPKSAIPLGDGLAGLAGLGAVWLAVMLLRPPAIIAAWLVLLATASPMLIRELRRLPAASREHPAFGPIVWLLGFVVATLPFMLVYAQAADVWRWAASWVVVAPAILLRMLVEVRRAGRVSPGFPLALGRALLSPSRAAFRQLAAPARLWSLKAFFVPLYGTSLHALIAAAFAVNLATPFGWLILLVTLAYTIDLGFALSGYIFAATDVVPVRSTQTLVLGWIVCLLCYQPLFVHWPDFAAVVHQEIGWPQTPLAGAALVAGAAGMLVLLALYVWATIVFGLRFCNLSNRGLIAHGPYRYMKHPAYFAHAGNAWIITLIFLPAAGIALGPSQLLVPIAFTLLYGLRSLTEERHMSEDPAYVAYIGWIARHGLVARLRRLILRRPA